MTNNISGLWGGRYWYPGPSAGSVHFSAWLVIHQADFTGTILEPNTILIDGPDELSADLEGTVTAGKVMFSKTYTLIQQPPVIYSGQIQDNATRIVGTWCFPDMLDYVGHFEMTRQIATQAKKSRVAAPVT